MLVSAIGTFATPSVPDIEGLESFAGPCFHSARWEHEHDLAGRRVAVIGTGASAAQIVPELAKVRRPVHVFQRTPQWILPRSDKPFTEEQKRRFARNPTAATAPPRARSTGPSRTPSPSATARRVAEQLKAMALSHIDYRITDDELRAKLTPDYPFGCKRTLVCSDFYKACCATTSSWSPSASSA